MVRRKSPSGISSSFLISPVKNPRPSGLYATIGMSNSAQALATPFSRISVLQRLNSTSTADTVTSLAARRMVSSLHSDNEIPPSLPAFTYSFAARIVISIGVSGSQRAASLSRVSAYQRQLGSRQVPDIELLVGHYIETLINAPSCILSRPIRLHTSLYEASLDGDDDLRGVTWVLVKVFLEQM